ncbi:hypothetical protein OQJ65_19985 [Vibrio sp. Sgm 22]|uniref:hypothetical protein n=1 Tax=Vibrio TaxID=662 RepID=UPI000E09C942|nr:MULTISPECIES: hypothetical protein [Vibrio]MCX2760526.1 hypothetical protein [Vibrio sp. 14G-20]MCX2777596.1 hypothetical protein [Vibrio sp. Sgm 22]UWZ99609.1 hypothetical protein IM698_21190 [Vibrio splendidus]
MKLNIHKPSIQQDIKNATSFMNGALKNQGLTARVNGQSQIEVKTNNGVVLKRIEGAEVAKKMNGVNIYV